jgi:hypothetical protein
MHGIGKYELIKLGIIYEGEFINDEMTGKGTMLSKNGDSWEGNFIKGKKHGPFVCTEQGN